jgi:hypothetical protein
LPVVEGTDDDDPLTYETVSPRLGLNWALGPERATLARLSLARFAGLLAASDVHWTNPAAAATVRFAFDDRDGNGRYDPGEPFDVLETSGFDAARPSAAVGANRDDPSLEAPLTDEVVLGLSHSVLPELVVEADVTYRLTHGVHERRPLVADGSDVVRVAGPDDWLLDRTISSDGAALPYLPDGSPWSAELWTLRPGLRWTGGAQRVNGEREVESLAYDLALTKRLSYRWMARGGLRYVDSVWRVPTSYRRYQSPVDLSPTVAPGDRDGEIFLPQAPGVSGFGGQPVQSGWEASLSGLYQIAPERPWGFDVATNLQWREGYALPCEATTVTTDGRTWTVQATEAVDRFRSDDVFAVDLRVEKRVPLQSDLTGTVTFDALNALDDRAALHRDTRLERPTANHVTGTTLPRVYRVGFRLAWR